MARDAREADATESEDRAAKKLLGGRRSKESLK